MHKGIIEGYTMVKRPKKTPAYRKKAEEITSILVDKIKTAPFHELSDIGIMLGLAYYGYKVWGPHGILPALIGYKLAVSPGGGTPPLSQATGLGILGALGITGWSTSLTLPDIQGKIEFPSQEKIQQLVDEIERGPRLPTQEEILKAMPRVLRP